MTFEEVWKSLEEKDTTGKYKQAREISELTLEQLEYAYNSGYADGLKSRSCLKGRWEFLGGHNVCTCCLYKGSPVPTNYCPNCGALMNENIGGIKDEDLG